MTDFDYPASGEQSDVEALDLKRRAVVVAGMHRSGTSALARVLGLLGAALPEHPSGDAPDNPTGFWESLPIKEFNDEVLTAAESRWDDISAVPRDWFSSPVAASLLPRATALLTEEYRESPLFVLKDPRLCRLLPFWQQAFAATGVEAGYVLPLRNPLEVAASLKERDGFSTSKSLLLWLDYVLEAELWTRDRPRSLVRYEDLLRDWQGVTSRIAAELDLSWPKTGHRTQLEIERFLSLELRHHAYADHEVAARSDVAAWVKRAYGALLTLAAGEPDEEAEYAALDQVAAELRDADSAYGRLVAELELDRDEQGSRLRSEAAAAVEEQEHLREQLGALEQERSRLRVRLGALEEESGRLRSEAAAGSEEHDRLREQLRAVEEERSRLHSEAAAESQAQAQLRAQLGGLEEELERLRSEVAAGAEEHDRLREQWASVEGERGRLAEQLGALEQDRNELQQQLSALEGDRNELHEQLRALEEDRSRLHTDVLAASEAQSQLQRQLEAALEARAVYAEEARRGARRADDLVAARDEIERLNEQLRERLQAHSDDLRELGRARVELETRLVKFNSIRDDRDRLAAEMDRRLKVHSEDLRELGRVRTELETRSSQLDALTATRERLTIQLDELARDVEALELERSLLQEQLGDLQAEHAAVADELEAARHDVSSLASEVARERESARSQLLRAARERERLQGELEARVSEHSASLLELGRARTEVAMLQTELARRSLRGRLRRLRRWPLVRLYLLWAAVVPAGVRLRVRYASQLASWLLRPTPTRLRWVRAYFSLRRSGLFDYRYYVLRNPDVARARLNPLMHYLEHGAQEGRDASARFSTRAYLEHRPGLDPARRNPLYEALRAGDAALGAPALSPAGSAVEAPPEAQPEDAPDRRPADWRHPSATGVDVICLPIIDWHYRFQRPQQLATQCAAAGHRVFYAETKFHDTGDRVEVDPLVDGVWGVRLPGPAGLVIYKSQLDADELDAVVEALDDFRKEARISRAIVIVDLPFWAPVALEAARRFGWRVVYDCMDDHAGFLDDGFGSAAVRILIEENEEALLHRSDAVLTTSKLLHDRVRPIARRTLHVPNGTDFAHFNRTPATLALDPSLARPVVGYYGAISSWFDVELVEAAARARPHWSFALVGSTFGADVSALEKLPNVHLYGERPYHEIPSFLHDFDVACIPFKLNALTEATNPVKFYEYLSAGKPVVSVPLPELEPYGEHYYAARTADEFVAQVERALAEHSPQKASERVAFALENTWSARWKELDRLVRSWFGRVVIAVLSYDNAEYLRLCLESIWAKTEYPNFEVVVVQNGSDAEIDAYLAGESEVREKLRVLRPGSNLGFAGGNNLAVKLAGDAEYVVLLNDDTVVTEGWLTGLLRHLEDETVGIVGPVTNFTGNEAKIDVDYDGVDGLDAFAAEHARNHAGEAFDIKSLAMYCVAVRRSLYDSLGGLDERFEVGMFEDDDFAEAVREVGLRVVCAEDVFVHHWGRASFRRMSDTEYDALFAANKARFEEKWGRPWVAHTHRS